jgi:hypothetical protein
MHVTVLRLQIVAPGSAARARCLFWIFLLNAGILVMNMVLYFSVSRPSILMITFYVLLGASALLYLLFQYQCLSVFVRVAMDARTEARFNTDASEASSAIAARAFGTVMLLAASAGTTLLYLVARFYNNIEDRIAIYLAVQVSVALDVPFDAALAVLCAGLVGPQGDQEKMKETAK